MMEKIEATFSIVTPMFLGGANGQAELRAPSIKGLLRFWWRTITYPSLNGNLKKLSENESKLFGSNETGSPFQLQLLNGHKKPNKTNKDQKAGILNRPGTRYLSFGLRDTSTKQLREFLYSDQDFTIIAISKNQFPDSLLKAFKMFGMLGGLGSRSRKGYGSITLNQIKVNNKKVWKRPKTEDEYRKELTTLIGQAIAFNQEPKISAFSSYTRIKYTEKNDCPIYLLNYWGEQMQRYRSWRYKGSIKGIKSEQNFKDDHDWFRKIGDYRETDFHPRRVVFGLPHNYDSKKAEGRVKGENHDRRSSPLLFHIHKLSSEGYIGVAILLRSLFLPKDEEINAGDKLVPQDIQWEVIEKFLNNKTYFSKQY
jgi:CRISPR-associated protein Cmr1